MNYINVIGAGLAGCEAAYQIAKRGINVKLYEMKPAKKSPAHKSNDFAELVCSNSLKARRFESAAGMLKQELRMLDSLLIKCADESAVPAGGALAVDRDIFSKKVSEEIKNIPNITVIENEVTEINENEITVIATGPLTSDLLSGHIAKKYAEGLYFYDAAAPIVFADSIDYDNAFYASRYEKGGDTDYLNCPLSKEEYEKFYNELINAEKAHLHGVDTENPKVYEGCMPIEAMARRGADTMRFGPMKPVGLRDPKTGHRPWAVLQLRKENKEATMFNLVGFQTNLKFMEQKRVFGLIHALKNAEFARYGVMHRNTFLNSPQVLKATYNTKSNEKIFFAGQITGVEGYVESISSGLLAGNNAANLFFNKPLITLPKTTVTGALASYISDEFVTDFQPMGANLGILPSLDEPIRDKKLKAAKMAERSFNDLKAFLT